MNRPFKWGTICLWTPSGSKDTSRQSWKTKKQVVQALDKCPRTFVANCMCLIQPLKFRTLKTGCFKMPRLQTTVVQTGITVASGQSLIQLFWRPKNCIWAFKEYLQLQMLHFQMGFTVACGQYAMFRRAFILAHNWEFRNIIYLIWKP